MNIVVIAFIGFTFIVLISGVLLMASGHKTLNRRYSNKLMSLRVIFQAIAIAALALIYFLSKKGL
jgi:hypothetical protein